HAIKQDNFSDRGFEYAQNTAAGEHAYSPGNFNHTHLILSASKVLKCHQREENRHRHNAEGSDNGEEEHVGEPFINGYRLHADPNIANYLLYTCFILIGLIGIGNTYKTEG